MDDAFLVGRRERVGELSGNLQGLVDGHRTACQPLGQRAAFNQFEDEELRRAGLLEAMDGRDRRVIQCREQLGFAPEARRPLSVAREVGG